MSVQVEWLSDDTLWIRGLPRGASESLRATPGVADVSEAWVVTAVFLAGDVCPSTLDVAALLASASAPESAAQSKTAEVPVDWSRGLDLEETAQQLGLTPGDIIQMVEDAEFTVEAIGFQPGFPYLSGLPEPLCGIPRRVPPRGRVPKGAIAIAEDMAGIYPSESPGGWNVLGVTDLPIYENDTCLLQVGDRVKFVGVRS